jgi:tetratricopeptide (TPR) repeat protein
LGPRRYLAWILAELGHFDRAATQYRAVLAIAPDYANGYHGLGCALQRLSKHHEAIVAFREAIDKDPHNPLVYYNLAISYLALGELQDALVSARRAARLGPDDAGFVGSLGTALGELRHWEQAAECHRRALALNPTFDHAYNLGVSLSELGRYREAEDAFRTAIRLGPADGDVTIRLALTLRDQERVSEGITILQGATAGATTDGVALSALADLYRCAGRVDDATIAAQRAVALRPDLAAPHAVLGWVLLEAGSPAAGLESFDRAVRIDPEDLDHQAGKVVALSRVERHAEAMALFEEISRRAPDYIGRHEDLVDQMKASRAALRLQPRQR